MFKESADRIAASLSELGKVGKMMDIARLRKDINDREAEAGDPTFWTDSVKAKKKSKELNDLKKQLSQYEKAETTLNDLKVHLELAAEMED